MTSIVSAIWNHFSHIFNTRRSRRRERRHRVYYNSSRRRHIVKEDENLAKELQEIEDFEFARHLQQEEDIEQELAPPLSDLCTNSHDNNDDMLLENNLHEGHDHHELSSQRRRLQSEEQDTTSFPFAYSNRDSGEQLGIMNTRMPYEGHRLHQSLSNVCGIHQFTFMNGMESTSEQMEPCLRAWSLSDLDNPPLQFDSPRPYDTHSSYQINSNDVSLKEDYFIYNELYPVSPQDEDDPPLSNNCTICLNDIGQTGNDNIKCLPCMHIFHEQCIDQWLTENDSCPVCRVSTLD